MREETEGAPRGEEGNPGVERKSMKATATRTESTPVEIRNDNKHFFYYCPKLDLWAVGRTKEEAESRLKEEIQLLLARCREYLESGDSLNGNGYATIEIRPS
jgi:predicted RNase H-like HicB family nuclease